MRSWVALAAFIALGCGESHSVSDAGDDARPPTPEELPAADDALGDLSDDDYLTLCRWWAWRHGWLGPGEELVECPTGSATPTVRLYPPEECADRRIRRSTTPECMLTAGAYYDCDASGWHPCDGVPVPEPCWFPAECATSGGMFTPRW